MNAKITGMFRKAKWREAKTPTKTTVTDCTEYRPNVTTRRSNRLALRATRQTTPKAGSSRFQNAGGHQVSSSPKTPRRSPRFNKSPWRIGAAQHVLTSPCSQESEIVWQCQSQVPKRTLETNVIDEENAGFDLQKIVQKFVPSQSVAKPTSLLDIWMAPCDTSLTAAPVVARDDDATSELSKFKMPGQLARELELLKQEMGRASGVSGLTGINLTEMPIDAEIDSVMIVSSGSDVASEIGSQHVDRVAACTGEVPQCDVSDVWVDDSLFDNDDFLASSQRLEKKAFEELRSHSGTGSNAGHGRGPGMSGGTELPAGAAVETAERPSASGSSKATKSPVSISASNLLSSVPWNDRIAPAAETNAGSSDEWTDDGIFEIMCSAESLPLGEDDSMMFHLNCPTQCTDGAPSRRHSFGVGSDSLLNSSTVAFEDDAIEGGGERSGDAFPEVLISGAFGGEGSGVVRSSHKATYKLPNVEKLVSSSVALRVSDAVTVKPVVSKDEPPMERRRDAAVRTDVSAVSQISQLEILRKKQEAMKRRSLRLASRRGSVIAAEVSVEFGNSQRCSQEDIEKKRKEAIERRQKRKLEHQKISVSGGRRPLPRLVPAN